MLAFTIALPVLLVAWASALSTRLPTLPMFHPPAIGAVIATAGFVLMISAMWVLQAGGGGLPMNAFPPPRLVTTGAYGVIDHPIYLGFILACAWCVRRRRKRNRTVDCRADRCVVCAAPVLGYERNGSSPPLRGCASTAVPAPSSFRRLARPDVRDIFSVLVLVFLPWVFAYELIGHITPATGIQTCLPFESTLPVMQWTEWAYASAYPVTLLAAFSDSPDAGTAAAWPRSSPPS